MFPLPFQNGPNEEWYSRAKTCLLLTIGVCVWEVNLSSFPNQFSRPSALNAIPIAQVRAREAFHAHGPAGGVVNHTAQGLHRGRGLLCDSTGAVEFSQITACLSGGDAGVGGWSNSGWDAGGQRWHTNLCNTVQVRLGARFQTLCQ